MKKPLIALTLMVVLVALALIFSGRKPTGAPATNSAAISTLLSNVAASSTATTTPTPASSAPKTIVAIQDGKTLDFSTGKPVLKDSAEEKAIIEQSVKEMNEAAAGVTFGPAPKAPAPDTKKPAPQE